MQKSIHFSKCKLDKYLSTAKKMRALLIIITLFNFGCKHEKVDLPKERYSLFDSNNSFERVADSIFIHVNNVVNCPFRIKIKSNIPYLQNLLNNLDTLLLKPHEEVSLKLQVPDSLGIGDKPFQYLGYYGDPNTVNPDYSFEYSLPFDKGKTSKIIQGYNGSFSHNSPINQYGIDFKLNIGDTIRAARGGVVVGKIDQYTLGGRSDKYKPFANKLVIFHKDGTFAQYLHLQPSSAFVNLGDSVKINQAIALNGQTGWSSTPHLHFSLLLPTAKGAKSIPSKFKTIDGAKLLRGVRIKHE